jgi:hypothetical protein
MTTPAPGHHAFDREAAVTRWKDTLEDIVELMGEINGPEAAVSADPHVREAATGRLARLLALDDTGEDLDEDVEAQVVAPEVARNGHDAGNGSSAAAARTTRPVAHDGGPKPPPAFVPAAPGTVIDLEPSLPWSGGPGFVAPARQPMAIHIPTSGAALAKGRIGFGTAGRSFRGYTGGRRGRVRIIWERLISRRHRSHMIALAYAGVLLVVVAAAAVVVWFVSK